MYITKDRLLKYSILIGAMSAAILLLQINLTRIFSYVLFHHLVTLAISVPFIGLGAAGSSLAVNKLKDRIGSSTFENWLLQQTIYFSVTLILAIVLTSHIPIKLLQFDKPVEIVKLFIFISIITIPFYYAGLVICSILEAAGENTGKIYAADLIGAVSGCILLIPALQYMGAEKTVYASAFIIPILFFVLTKESLTHTPKYFYPAVGFALLSFIGLNYILPIRAGINKDQRQFEDNFVKHCLNENKVNNTNKDCSKGFVIDYYKWNLIARIDVSDPIELKPGFGGGSGKNTTEFFNPTQMRLIFQDGSAPTGIVDMTKQKIEDLKWTEHLLQSVPYQLVENPDVAIVGVGGGPDILLALHNGAKSVTGAEVNSVTVSLLKDKYKEYSGNLVDNPKVKLLNMEGRNFFTVDKGLYDIIHLSGVDTYTTVSSGSMAVSESFLYTVEAIRDMYKRLKPGGMICITRWRFSPPRETLRLANIMLEAMVAEGVKEEDARKQLLVFGQEPDVISWAAAVLKKGEYTTDQVQKLESWIQKEGFDLIYLQGASNIKETEFTQVLNADNRRIAVDSYYYDIRPTTDDWSFFFNFYRWDRIFSPQPSKSVGGYFTTTKPIGYILALITTIIAGVLAFGLVWYPVRNKSGLVRNAGGFRFILYFAGLGFGFIFIELGLIHKLIVLAGGPVYSMSVVLAALLLSTGIGSYASNSLKQNLPKNAIVAVSFIVLTGLGFYFIGIKLFFPYLMQLDNTLRIMGILFAIFPLGFTLGMAFPLGIQHFCKDNPDLIPYAWAINTSLTVLGSNMSLIIPTFTGASFLFLLGIAFYGLNLLSLLKKNN